MDARWEEPFRSKDTAHHGQSGRLYNLTTVRLVEVKQAGLNDRIHLDDLRVCVSWDVPPDKEVEAVGIVRCNKVVWKGERAEERKSVGSGAVNLGRSMNMEVILSDVG